MYKKRICKDEEEEKELKKIERRVEKGILTATTQREEG